MARLEIGPRALVLLLRILQCLPMPILVLAGRALGRLLYVLAHERRHIALRNVQLCFAQWDPEQHRAVVREHFALLGRSLVERALLWYAPVSRLRRLIHIEGDIGLAERSTTPVMWLVPHFVGLEVAGAAVQLFQSKVGVDIYQTQSSPYLDRVLKQGRLRFGRGMAFARGYPIRRLLHLFAQGHPFFNMPDQDFGAKDAAFIEFFGVPAATLLAPSRMARFAGMTVQPVVVDMLPGAQGWRVRFLPAWQDWPTEDPVADTRRMNAFIEEQVRRQPAQYFWVHKRFKTRPPGESSLYDGH